MVTMSTYSNDLTNSQFNGDSSNQVFNTRLNKRGKYSPSHNCNSIHISINTSRNSLCDWGSKHNCLFGNFLKCREVFCQAKVISEWKNFYYISSSANYIFKRDSNHFHSFRNRDRASSTWLSDFNQNLIIEKHTLLDRAFQGPPRFIRLLIGSAPFVSKNYFLFCFPEEDC